MELKKDDLFIVTRGLKLSKIQQNNIVTDSCFNIDSIKEPVYDLSYTLHSQVFKVIAVCGPSVIAERIHTNYKSTFHIIGQRMAFDLNEIEVWPVTQEYLSALKGE